ncbi:tyrosine-protein phosphatase [Tundrisphaera sp. TA3]|uniref:tyrosine-protein phosphatase n=1 Tax=Tundrisphaera sp. TA3 TaxID=3435775 RepID=UPI003EB6B213
MASWFAATPRRKARRKVFLAGSLAFAAVFSAYFHRPLFRGNVGIVDPGRVVRSAQPTGDRLADLTKDHGLATVLNLRGGSDSDAWYKAEVADAARLGLDFYDFPMNATSRPPRRQLLAVLDLLDRCRYPLLIHCKSGSDRTGLVAGLYLLSRRGVPPEQAERALTLVHGHVPILDTRRMHDPFDEYADWLRIHGQAHTPALFRAWVERDYRSDDPLVAFRPVTPGPRPPRVAQDAAAGEPTPR